MKHLFKFSLCALALTMSANTGFAQSGETGLKDAYKDYFSIGVAVNMRNISNPEQIAIIKKDFNSITAENDMKPQALGQVFSDGADNGRTVLHFQLRKEKEKLNPEPWLNR